jgi:hypothetical protein
VALRECTTDAAGAGRLGAAHSVSKSAESVRSGASAGRAPTSAADADPDPQYFYNPASFSYWVAQIIRRFIVSRQSVTEEEAAEWFDEFAKLEKNGAYFFCITPVLTEAVNVV